MTEGIIVAIITGLCAVAGQWLITRRGRAEDAAERARLDERTDQRLRRIEEKLDEHNHYAERIGSVQTDIAALRADVANLKTK